MKKVKNKLILEYIIHPGMTLNEVLEDRKISQEQLAIRTDFSRKYISNIINGQMNISVELAEKLECILKIEKDFWMNLQEIYDREMEECKM